MEQDDKTTKATGFFTALFTGWGVPGGIARILAGAVIGALAALAALAQSGCSADYHQSADGVDFSGSLVFFIDNINK